MGGSIRVSSRGRQLARLVTKMVNILVILTIFAPELRLRRGEGGGKLNPLLIDPTTDSQPYINQSINCDRGARKSGRRRGVQSGLLIGRQRHRLTKNVPSVVLSDCTGTHMVRTVLHFSSSFRGASHARCTQNYRGLLAVEVKKKRK